MNVWVELDVQEAAFLQDFIWGTLAENSDDDPFPLAESEILLSIRRKIDEHMNEQIYNEGEL